MILCLGLIFDKSSYLSDSEIEKQYREKINSLEDGGEETRDKFFKASLYDPRRTDVYFGSKESAEKAQEIANRLHIMSKEEFMASDYPYKWIDELPGVSIYKIVNKKVLIPKD